MKLLTNRVEQLLQWKNAKHTREKDQSHGLFLRSIKFYEKIKFAFFENNFKI